MMVVFALAAATLCGVMALCADVGVLYYNWVQLQKAADAAALAGANYLPNDTSKATTTATTYGTNNGISDSDVFTATPINTNSQMQVTIKRTVPYSFARTLGLTSGYVNVSAVATVPAPISTVNGGPNNPIGCNGSACGGGVTASSGTPGSGAPLPGGCGTATGSYNILPIAVDNKTGPLWNQGGTYTLNRVDSTGSGANGPWPDAPGNWGLVDLCGQGSGGGSAIRTALANGYYGELSIGNTLTTFPGAKVGPVNQGLQGLSVDRLSGPSSPSQFNQSDPRAVIVPLVDFSNCTGACSVKITGFMAFYITSVSGGAVTGTFVSMVDPNSTSSINAPNAGAKGDVVLLH
jgi:Putative Flp pilus-assembly TadE/G-like